MAIALVRVAVSHAHCHRHTRRPSSRSSRIVASSHSTTVHAVSQIPLSDRHTSNTTHLNLALLAHQTSTSTLPMRLDTALPHRKTLIAERRVVPRLCRRYALLHCMSIARLRQSHIEFSSFARNVHGRIRSACGWRLVTWNRVLNVIAF